MKMIDACIGCICWLFIAKNHVENIAFIWRRYHYRWRAVNFCMACVRYLWPLSRKVSLSCHTCCNKRARRLQFHQKCRPLCRFVRQANSMGCGYIYYRPAQGTTLYVGTWGTYCRPKAILSLGWNFYLACITCSYIYCILLTAAVAQ